jgi:hypothetical protein
MYCSIYTYLVGVRACVDHVAVLVLQAVEDLVLAAAEGRVQHDALVTLHEGGPVTPPRLATHRAL